jgi:hypothetical protein
MGHFLSLYFNWFIPLMLEIRIIGGTYFTKMAQINQQSLLCFH